MILAVEALTGWFESTEIPSRFFFSIKNIPSIRDRNKLEINISWVAVTLILITWPLEPPSNRPYLTPSSSWTLFSSVSDSKVILLITDSPCVHLFTAAEVLFPRLLPNIPDQLNLATSAWLSMVGHLRAPSSDFHNLVSLSDTPML